jgi:plasmid stabilization system protein ParE
MTPRLTFRQQARAELLAARDWYEGRAPGLGLEFVRAVDAAFDLIARMPEAFTALSGTVRHAVLRRFPYSILFAYENDEVIILAIHHHRQAPTRWQS